ncbi:hypothetical protein ACFL5V_00320 [Fibrobacterota bacterium]
MVLTVGFAGINLHQFLSSYKYIQDKISELKDLVQDDRDVRGLNLVSLVFYFILPTIYLIILAKARFFSTGVMLVLSKFMVTAALGMWTQKRVFTEPGYTKRIHLLGKIDNFLNILVSVVIAYVLLFPL